MMKLTAAALAVALAAPAQAAMLSAEMAARVDAAPAYGSYRYAATTGATTSLSEKTAFDRFLDMLRELQQVFSNPDLHANSGAGFGGWITAVDTYSKTVTVGKAVIDRNAKAKAAQDTGLSGGDRANKERELQRHDQYMKDSLKVTPY